MGVFFRAVFLRTKEGPREITGGFETDFLHRRVARGSTPGVRGDLFALQR